jgi:ribosomal-protein-alanine N-acetyltransferase
MQWFGTGATFSPAQIADSLADVIAEYATPGLGNYAVVEKDTTKIIGHCGLHRGREPDIAVELDCLIVRDRWKLGYGAEAAAAVIKDAVLGAHFGAISAVARGENQAAIALMRKLGMSYVRDRIRFGFNSVLYEVVAGQFLARFS